MNYKPGICTFCGTGCGHMLKVNNDQIDGVFPSQNHPFSNGRLCVRGWHIHELLRSNDRIKKPLVKTNSNFEKLSLDEAIEKAYKKLSSYSGDEIAFLGSPRSSNEDNYLLMKLARQVFKSSNISLNSESGHRNSLNVLKEGTGMAGMTGSLTDIKNSDLIIVTDFEMSIQNPIIASEIHQAALSGTKVVTIDSRKTQIAKLSNKFLQTKPGTTKIIFAAMAKILLEKGKVDNKAQNFSNYESALKKINIEKLFSLTGIELKDIEELALELMNSEKAMVFFPSGVSGLDADTISHIYNLFLLTDNIGKDGCGVNPLTGISNLQGSFDMGATPDLLTGFQSISDKKTVGNFEKIWKSKFNTDKGKTYNELISDKNSNLKAIVVVEHDEGIIQNIEQLENLDFILYIGSLENPFTEYADIVIPTSMYSEYDGTYTNTERRIQLNRKKVSSPEGILPAWNIFSKIAEKSSTKWNYKSADEVMEEIASVTPTYSGISYSKLNSITGIKWPCDKKSPEGTESFIAENGSSLKFVSVTSELSIPNSDDSYPTQLLLGKSHLFWHQNNTMKKTMTPKREFNTTLLLYPKGYIEISYEDAKKLEVRDKWPVVIKSNKAEMKVEVMITDAVKPGTACVPYFIKDMISEFLLKHSDSMSLGENATIPVKIERV